MAGPVCSFCSYGGFQYLGEVEGVELELLSLLKRHDLNVESPGREVPIGNGIVQVSDSIIWVSGSQTLRLRNGQILYPLISLKKRYNYTTKYKEVHL